MQIVNNILHKLNSIEGLETVLYESGFGTNLRIDRKPTPAAVLYMLQTYSVSLNGNTKKDSVDLEVFIFDRCDLAAKGEVVQEKLDTLQPFVNQFIALLANDKSLLLDGNTVTASMAYGQFDAHVCGWSLQLKLTERQGICIDNNASGVKTVYITQNGEYDVTQYGIANVNVQSSEIRLQEKTATENGIITPDLGFNGLSKVNVSVPQPQGETSVEITRNGTETFDITNYESIVVTTNVPTQTCNLYNGFYINQNGTYDPSQYGDYDGFGSINVDVQPQNVGMAHLEAYDIGGVQDAQYFGCDYLMGVDTRNIRIGDPVYITENHGWFDAQYFGFDLIRSLQIEAQPEQVCEGTLDVFITNKGNEWVDCCGYQQVYIDTTQIHGFNTWTGTYADFMEQFPLDGNTLYLITD